MIQIFKAKLKETFQIHVTLTFRNMAFKNQVIRERGIYLVASEMTLPCQ